MLNMMYYNINVHDSISGIAKAFATWDDPKFANPFADHTPHLQATFFV